MQQVYNKQTHLTNLLQRNAFDCVSYLLPFPKVSHHKYEYVEYALRDECARRSLFGSAKALY